MKIVALSDMHGLLPVLPKTDVVIIAGDISPLNIQRKYVPMKDWFTTKFVDWVRRLDCERVVLVAGNHDFFFEETNPSHIEFIINELGLANKLIYLENTSYLYNGVSFYGTPICEGPQGWAFSNKGATSKYSEIPDCDILITHQPPRIGKLGCSYPNQAWERNFGSSLLAEQIVDKKIKLNFCGHIHTGDHSGVMLGDTKCYNVSMLDEDYECVYEPLVVEYEGSN